MPDTLGNNSGFSILGTITEAGADAAALCSNQQMTLVISEK